MSHPARRENPYVKHLMREQIWHDCGLRPHRTNDVGNALTEDAFCESDRILRD